ncbi:MAG: hypothetical protein KAW09_03545, partial [Thermoplasmata archaeon]|nr:hypothetical protein [Thermoplasmata archaeon]
MKISVLQGEIQEVEDEGIVVNLFEGVRRPGGAAGAVDKALDRSITGLIRSGDFKGKYKESCILRTEGRIPSPRVLIVGLGKRKEITLDRVREVSGVCAKEFNDLECGSFSTIVHGAGVGGIPPAEAAEAVAEGSLLSVYKFRPYKTEKKDEEKELEKVTIVEYDRRKIGRIQKAVAAAEIISSAANGVRDLVNMPGNDKPPSAMAEIAKQIAKESKIKLKILEEKDAKRLGMGAYLGVTRGSDQPAKFIVLEYEGKKGQKPVVLVGKGITFDTGGISLKPMTGLWPLWTMKEDMSGAATVMYAIKAVADLNLPLHVVALV